VSSNEKGKEEEEGREGGERTLLEILDVPRGEGLRAKETRACMVSFSSFSSIQVEERRERVWTHDPDLVELGSSSGSGLLEFSLRVHFCCRVLVEGKEASDLCEGGQR